MVVDDHSMSRCVYADVIQFLFLMYVIADIIPKHWNIYITPNN